MTSDQFIDYVCDRYQFKEIDDVAKLGRIAINTIESDNQRRIGFLTNFVNNSLYVGVVDLEFTNDTAQHVATVSSNIDNGFVRGRANANCAVNATLCKHIVDRLFKLKNKNEQ